MRNATLAALVFISFGPAASLQAAPHVYELDIAFTPEVRAEPYTGRVYVFFSKGALKEPRKGPDWFHPEPFIAHDVVNWKPGEKLRLSSTKRDRIYGFPKPWGDLALEGYTAQAVARFNPYERTIGSGTGNGFSPPAPFVAPADGTVQAFTIDKLVVEAPFPESKYCKLLDVPSEMLESYHERKMSLKGTVILPKTYFADTQRRYPVIFNIPGFGGTHLAGVRKEPVVESNAEGVEFIRVTLDPSCPLGHHVFADSANNGPVGAALIREFIPALDKQYRTVAQPWGRLLMGHSSGGWSSLWLQVTYPDVFGGTWSTAPDPVDFRDFQRIDLYRSQSNMYRDNAGQRRPLARMANRVVLWYEEFDRMETTLGYGGQLHSFEAVFSPRGSDGRPMLAWDRKTGAVNTEVTKAWEKYDIRLVLERRWDEIGPQLQGKLHVYMGDADTFYLDGACRLLQPTLQRLRGGNSVEMVPGRNHFDLLTGELVGRMRNEMVQTFIRGQRLGAK